MYHTDCTAKSRLATNKSPFQLWPYVSVAWPQGADPQPPFLYVKEGR